MKRNRIVPPAAPLPLLALAFLLVVSCNDRPAPPATAPATVARQMPAPAPARAEPPAPSPPPVAGAADPALAQRLIAAMSGYEHLVTKDELDRLGEPAALTAALLAVSRDPAVHLAVRTNALASLRFYPSPASRAAFETALLAPDTPDVIRRSAVKAFGAGFGQDAVPVLAKVLTQPEIHTRNAAAKTLAQIGGLRAREALRQRLPGERDALVKSSIEAGLRQP